MSNTKVSIILPSRNEIFLQKTILDLLAKAKGDIEVIAICDGYYPPAEEIVNDKRVIYFHEGTAKGLRNGINMGASLSTGKYLMKLDAHCMVDEGFDEKLKEGCDDMTVIIPRRKRLDPFKWEIQDVGKLDVDYEFLSYPYWKPDEVGIHGTIWDQRIKERLNDPRYDIDEDMSFQGSCWFMTKNFFLNTLEGMQEEGYGTFIGEPQEISMKVWLSGGRLLRNKKTWYAHWHKGKEHGRGYFIDKRGLIKGNAYSVDYWMNNRWPKAIHDMAWLIEHFWPVPTWPEDRSLWKLK